MVQPTCMIVSGHEQAPPAVLFLRKLSPHLRAVLPHDGLETPPYRLRGAATEITTLTSASAERKCSHWPQQPSRPPK